MTDQSETAAERVAEAADAYLNAELCAVRASNALDRESEPGATREALAETAWETACARNEARDALTVALFSWRAGKND